MRKLLVLLVVLGALAVAADRASLALAERAVADQLRTSEDLAATPTVDLGGFPFLTQVLSGRYDEMRVVAEGVQRDGLRVEELDVTVRGVRAQLGDVLAGDVTALPVDGLRATALVTYAELARRTGLAGVTVQEAGDAVRVTAKVTVLGRTYTASAVSSLTLRAGVLRFQARTATIAGGADERLTTLAAQALAFRVPVGELPFDLSLDGVELTRDGVVLEASSGPTVLHAR